MLRSRRQKLVHSSCIRDYQMWNYFNDCLNMLLFLVCFYSFFFVFPVGCECWVIRADSEYVPAPWWTVSSFEKVSLAREQKKRYITVTWPDLHDWKLKKIKDKFVKAVTFLKDKNTSSVYRLSYYHLNFVCAVLFYSRLEVFFVFRFQFI